MNINEIKINFINLDFIKIPCSEIIDLQLNKIYGTVGKSSFLNGSGNSKELILQEKTFAAETVITLDKAAAKRKTKHCTLGKYAAGNFAG